jgi:hypothetical protein
MGFVVHDLEGDLPANDFGRSDVTSVRWAWLFWGWGMRVHAYGVIVAVPLLMGRP